ncbi:MAG TPA: hypothetical protein VLN26_17400 [Gaiellaceae bacterium]|nr:hypothetical protein [Gaiellaceae bacterium]
MVELLRSTRRTFVGRVAASVLSAVPAAVALARPRPGLAWAVCAGDVNCRIVGSRCQVFTLQLLEACYDAYTGVWCYTRTTDVGPC